MTTHELARQLLKLPDVQLFVNDDEISEPCLELVNTGQEDIVIFWTGE